MKRKLILASLILTLAFSNVCYALYPDTPSYTYTSFSYAGEKEFQNVSMLSLNSTAMLVKGATRYIDDDNLKITPTLVDARTYIPLKAAETLFHAYTEGDETQGNVDFRTGGSQKSSVKDTRLVLNKTSATVDGAKQSKNEYLIYIDGEAYMPLRKLGELIGYKVDYDNGYILIGTQSDINAIKENSDYFAYGKNILDKFVPASETGRAIFVAPNGKDKTGKGTLESPYKTIARATSEAKAGDTIYIREGTYRETIKPTKSGTAAKPITYKAYNNEKVVVSALETVGGFTDDETENDANFVKADLSAIEGWSNLGRGRNQIFYNGRALVEARFPNVSSSDYDAEDVSPFFPTKGDLKLSYDIEGIEWTLASTTPWEVKKGQYTDLYENKTYTSNSKYLPKKVEEWNNYYYETSNGYIYENGLGKTKTDYPGVYYIKSDLLNDDGVGDWVGATFVTLHGNAWNWGSAIVDSSKAGSFTVDPDSASKKWWYTYTDYNNQNRNQVNVGYLTNHKNAIDIPEEWNITDNTLYMYLPTGETSETLNTGKIEVKARQLVADLRERKYIQIDGIDFIGGSLTANYSEMCVIKNCNFDSTSHFDYSLNQRDGYLTTYDARVAKEPEAGEVGIYFGGTNDVIRDCNIIETAGAGVYLTGTYTMVENNYFLNCGYGGSTVGGIYVGSKAYTQPTDKRGGYVIKYNTVKNSARSAFTLQLADSDIFDHTTKNTAFLPSDISYNEFIDGSLCGWDTGVVYLWGATMGSETDYTQLHHNVISMSATPTGTIHSFIYHDNFISNIETRDNVMFYTNQNIKFYSSSFEDILVQSKATFPIAWSEAVVHDNQYHKYVSGGLGSLADSDYPDDLKFNAGVRR